MSKYLLVGDPHAVVEELDDMERLIDCVFNAAVEHAADAIVFLGDQHHNHAILNVEVMAFWRGAFKRLGQISPVYALVGNHDRPGDASSSAHAMMAYEGIPGLNIVDKPTFDGDIAMIPYMHDADKFLATVKSFTSKTILCHQTFDGSVFENGMYAPDGIDITTIADRHLISGHIHVPQKYANVTYVGAPRWRSLSDAGVERALVLAELDATNEPKFLKAIDTSGHCQKLVRLEDRQEAPLEQTLNPNWKYVIDVTGDEGFIASRKGVWAGCRVRTFKTNKTEAKVSESMGIGKAIQAFVEGFKPRYGTPPEILKTMVNQRLGTI